MSDRPILFSDQMIRAILDGRKTMTRRVLKPQPPDWCYQDQRPGYSVLTPKGHIEFRGRYVDLEGVDYGPASKFIALPYAIGDRLWCRETWFDPQMDGGRVLYAADDPPDIYPIHRKRPSIHMPRWASRLTLTVTDVRVQRVQDISEDDAVAEGLEWEAPSYGVPGTYFWNADARKAFRALWDSINAKRPGCSWEDNPWVVAVTFTSERRNIDAESEAA